MRVLGLVTMAGALVLIAIGAYLTSINHNGGPAGLIVGCVLALTMAIMWPLARRRGKV